MLIKKEETVAILVDYQDRILASMFNKEELLKRSKILFQGLKVLNVPMCKTQQYTKGLGMTVSEVNEACGLSSDDYFEKVKFSGVDVASDFIKGKKYVILCGIEAHVCVLQTLIELKEKGFIPILVTDCISSRTIDSYKIAIRRAKMEGAIIANSESILFELLGGANAPEFKAISKIVK